MALTENEKVAVSLEALRSSLESQLSNALKEIPEFQEEEAVEILEGRKTGNLDARRHDGNLILRVARSFDAFSVLWEAKKHGEHERQKRLSVSSRSSRSRTPLLEYHEAKTSNPYDVPRPTMFLQGIAAFEKGEDFIRTDLKKFASS